MKDISCIAIDDEPMSLLVIEQFCRRRGGISLAAYSEPQAGAGEIQRTKPPLVFLDIQMGSASGLDMCPVRAPGHMRHIHHGPCPIRARGVQPRRRRLPAQALRLRKVLPRNRQGRKAHRRRPRRGAPHHRKARIL